MKKVTLVIVALIALGITATSCKKKNKKDDLQPSSTINSGTTLDDVEEDAVATSFGDLCILLKSKSFGPKVMLFVGDNAMAEDDVDVKVTDSTIVLKTEKYGTFHLGPSTDSLGGNVTDEASFVARFNKGDDYKSKTKVRSNYTNVKGVSIKVD